MKKFFGFMCSALLAGTAVCTAPVFAEDAKPAGLKPDDVKNALGMSIYLQAGYTYNGKASDSSPFGTGSENDLRIYDHKANSFGLDLAELIFSRDTTTTSLGYRVKISAGETAKLIHAAGLGASTESFDITEAYVSYTAPVGKGLRFDIGKMMTFVGAEVMEALDNPNYSRSFLYNYAEPLTHTGVKASYVFTDNLNAALLIANGWDNATDNNDGKTAGVSVNITAGDPFSAYINYLQGPEQANNTRDNRSLIDLVATIKPVKPLTIILNYDDGKEDHAVASGTAKWSGASGIVKYDVNDTFSIAVRGEYFDDKDGFRTGLKQKLTEITLTPEFRLAGGLTVRPEYRHDSSDYDQAGVKAFHNGTKKTQDTFALAAMYRW
ncbi:MAG TPA: porin [Nitrospirota bacterium]|nr:porin [Nitrospirota bacterium]